MSAPEIHHATETPLRDSLPPNSEDDTSIAEPTLQLADTDMDNIKKPRVLIVGAGIGGLLLGNLLQKGGIPYEMFEKSTEVKPLGM